MLKSTPRLALLLLLLLPVTLVRGGGATPPSVRTLTLRQSTLRNVEDAAGRWQFEGGTVFEGDTQVAYYASTKRVVNGGTNAQNTAMVTTTVFFLGGSPPENITLEGSHDFSSGRQIGSVSAASEAHSSLTGRRYSRDRNLLTIE